MAKQSEVCKPLITHACPKKDSPGLLLDLQASNRPIALVATVIRRRAGHQDKVIKRELIGVSTVGHWRPEGRKHLARTRVWP